MSDQALHQGLLRRQVVHDEQPVHAEGERESGAVHDVEVIDGRRDLFAESIAHRVVQQRNAEVRHAWGRLARRQDSKDLAHVRACAP